MSPSTPSTMQLWSLQHIMFGTPVVPAMGVASLHAACQERENPRLVLHKKAQIVHMKMLAAVSGRCERVDKVLLWLCM